MAPTVSLPGARESNAGDDFHVLWATRRALGLLDLTSDLRMVVMEDLHPGEPPGVDPRLLLGVDLTEYFGADSLTGARRVVVSQLKYSQRHPERPWTAARLGRSSQTRPGVTRRLADVYRGMAKYPGVSRERLLSILDIRLVSNRPIAERLARSVRDAQRWLATRPNAVLMATMLAPVDAAARQDLERLFADSGLKSREFTDFLRVLALDGGQLERAEQELAITKALASHVAVDLERYSRVLYDLVRRRALPEGVNHPIRLQDILAALNVGGTERLFPAPSQFARPPTVIETPDPARILEALRTSSDRRVVAHGDAGVGKTTSVLSLARHLPPGSAVVVFDCFAGGDYLAPAHARHVPDRALVQLCNEIAVRCRLPLLVVPPTSPYDLWRELQRRLDHAARTLADVSAQVLLVVDAVDNSAFAARERHDPSFVPDLWALQVPPNAGLIATARTARLSQINLPDGIARVRLEGFDESASAAHLRTRFPDADMEAARDFHVRSQGNPRVQFYVLEGDREDAPATVTEAVAQAQLTPENIFEDLWEAAIVHAPDRDVATARLADLLCLTAPKRLEHLAGAADVDVDTIEAFCRALAPGLRLQSGAATLQDEDFEKYLQDKLAPDQWRQAHARLADYFASREGDPYAAGVLAEHLLGAGRSEELVRLAVEAGQPSSVVDPLARLQVYFRRVRLALGVSGGPAGRLAASQLLVLAAEAAISDQAVAVIIRERPELALRYGDPEAIAAVWRDDDNIDWQGPIHMRRSALFARRGQEHEARQEMRSADAWLLRRKEEDQRWDLSRSDVAAYIEAVYWLGGWDAALWALRRWRPWSAVFSIASDLVSRLRRTVSVPDLVGRVLDSGLPPQLQARLLVAASPSPEDVPSGRVAALAGHLAECWTRPANRAGEWPMAFVELVARVVGDHRLVIRLLDAFAPVVPARAPHRHEGLGEFERPLRAAALRAVCEGRDVTLDELMPPSVTSPSEDAKDRITEERSAMTEQVRPWLGTYQQRAVGYVRRPTVRTIAAWARAEIDKRLRTAEGAWYEPSYEYGQWLAVVCDTVLAARGSNRRLVATAADAATNLSGHGDVHVWATMARRLADDARYRDTAMVLVDRAAADAETRPQRASELSDFLLDLSEIASPHDPELAGDLYNRAVAAREGLDDEGVARLRMHAQLAPSLKGRPEAAVYAERIARSVVAYRPRVSDDDYLPWRETLRGATEMHPVAGLAIMARWEDQRHLRLTASLPYALPACVDADLLSATDALALFPFLAAQAFTSTTGALLDRVLADDGRAAAAIELAHLSQLVRRDEAGMSRSRAAADLRAWARANGFAHLAAIAALDPYVELVVTDDQSTMSPYRVAEKDTTIERLLAAADTCSPEGLIARLADLRDVYASESQQAEFLRRATVSTPPSRRVAVLEALTSLPSDDSQMRFRGETILVRLGDLLVRWSGSSAVAAWREAHLRSFLIAQLPNVVRYSESSSSRLSAFTSLAGTPQAAAELLTEGAALHIDELPAAGLFAVASRVALALEPPDKERLLDWSLARLEDGAPLPAAVGALSREQALSDLLWALFANPQKSVRWAAAHAARRIIGVDGERLASGLVAALGRREGGLFVDGDHGFLWMSAQVWLLMTLARVAGDRPESLIPVAQKLAAVALDRNWPHASVREFARRAALRVAHHRPDLLDSTTVAELTLANRPRACLAERGHHAGFGPLEDGRGDAQWHFSMDVDRYWFGSLGAHFREPKDDMLRRGERWIVDVLETPTDLRPRRDDTRLAHLNYSDLDTHHGSPPAVESYRVAAEYCALMLTAGELVDDGRAVLVETYDPVIDPWEDWLGRHLDARETDWVADLRDPTPPERVFLCAHVTQGAWPELSTADFVAMLGHPGSGVLIVDSYVDYANASAYGHDWVSSALVEPSTADALVRALEHADDMSFFPLPNEPRDDEYADHQVDDGPFRLLGWLREIEDHREGLERSDPLARIGLTTALPGTAFIEFHGANLLADHRTVVDRNARPIAWIRSFNDHPPGRDDRYRTDVTVGGRQTLVDVTALLAYLQAVEMDLIIKAHADRRDSDPYQRPRSRDLDRVQDINRVLLVEPSGRLRGLEGHRSIG